MRIDGNELSTYGLVLSRKSGFFDMPNRVAPFVYDWGDELEPLVGEHHMAFAPQIFTANCIFDPRLGGSLEATLATFDAMAEINVDIEGQSGAVGRYLCQILQTGSHRYYGSTAQKIDLTFYHRVPVFGATLPGTQTLGSSHFGGYNFSQFGIKVTLRREFVALPSLKESKQTTYQTGPRKTQFRAFKKIFLDCVLVGSSQADRLNKMEQFKLLLSQPGLHTLTHGGITFAQTFHTDGFKTTLLGNKVLKFTLTLNVVP